MRIGIFDPYLDTLGGGEKYMLTAAACLSKKHQVYLLWDSYSLITEAQKKFNLDLSRVILTPNIFSTPSLARRLLKTRNYDAIFYLSDGSIPLVLSKLYLHFQFPVEWVESDNLTTKIKIKRISKIICNSMFTKKYIDKKFKTDSVILYPPVSHGYEGLEKKKITKTNTILNVGRFGILPNKTTFKKQEVLIEAFKKIHDDGFKNWELVLVVSFKPEDRDKLEMIKNKIDKYPIKILENISFEELFEYYKKTKIYWHAAGFEEDLRRHPERAEHFGIVTVEAMGQGAVPVVIKAGGQLEIVKDGEDGYLWRTKKELIEKTVNLMKNQNLWNELSKKAFKRANTFSEERFSRELNEIIK